MRVTLNDELTDDVQAGLKVGQSVEQEIERRLKACGHVCGKDPLIVLNTTQMDAIAERLGTGLPIRTPQDLMRAIDQVAQVTVGNVRLVWTPTQLQQLEEKARKIGTTVDDLVARVTSKLLTDIFLIEPGAQGVFYTPGFDPTDALEDSEDDAEVREPA